MGDVVNLSARLMMAAPEGILCDAATRLAAGRGYSFEALPPRPLKGMEQPVAVFRPRGRGRVFREAAELVGRTTERGLLIRRLEELSGGTGGVVLVRGEPGIGKSRLLTDLLEQARERGLTALTGAGEAIEKSTPYHVWRSVFAGLLGLEGLADLDARRTRTLDRLRPLPDLLRLAPLLNGVVSVDLAENDLTAQMTGQVRADNTNDLLLSLLEQAAARSPLLLVLEDVQWFDSASWALTALAAHRLRSVLLVVSTRPLSDPVPAEDGLPEQLPNCQDLPLGPLPDDQSEILVCRRLGIETLPAAAGRLIREKAQGNPLFSEQLALALIDNGLLVVAGHRATAAPHLEQQAVVLPDSVQGVLVSRIDRLSPQLQMTVKVASVIGRVFAYRTLQDVYPLESGRTELRGHLGQLEQLGIVAPERRETEVSYVFKHTTLQEVAYNLMLYGQRRELHRAVAEWYQQAHRDDPEPFYPLLAHHWTRAEVEDRALEYQAKAGTQALRDGAYQEAVRFLSQALEGLDRVAEGTRDALWRARCQRQLGEAYLSLGRLADSRRNLLLATQTLGVAAPETSWRLKVGLAGQLAVQVGHRLCPWLLPKRGRPAPRLVEAARAYERLAEIHYLAAETGPLCHDVLRAVNLTESAGPCPELARAYAAMAGMAGFLPQHALARAYARRALQTVARVGQPADRAWVLEITSLYGIGVGQSRQVRRALEQASAIYAELGDRPHRGQALAVLAQMAHFRGEFARGMRLWREVYAAAEQHGNLLQQAWGLNGQAEGALWLGQDSDEVIGHLEAALAIFADNIDRISETSTHGLLAVAHLRSGRLEQARQAADAAARLIAQSGRPNGYYALEGYAGVAQVRLALWEAGDETLSAPSRRACADLHRYAAIFAIGRPRAWLCQGLADWLTGRTGPARRAWRRSLEAARQLAMPYEEGLALYELGRHLAATDPARRRHLQRACTLFSRLGTPVEHARAAREAECDEKLDALRH
jgi:tetratricopeptide (TPR) repeat protein